jgi:hypothetical protein
MPTQVEGAEDSENVNDGNGGGDRVTIVAGESGVD